SAEKEEAKKGEADVKDLISINDFAKLDLRVAEIVEAERVEGTDKLVRLEIDLGTEKRQIVAGIAQYYAADELVGKHIVVVANLEPAKVRGVESRGMLLAGFTEDRKELTLITVDKPVPNGSKVS
ncbi:MAG TPA: methionine--tRNA ligase subunit beta, partial [Firmicutes bacterium]|nr:methionine--tRNA ligase subunit beta [Bacillota bacterium]